MLSSYALTLFCCHQCILSENSCLLWQEMGLMAVKTPAWKAAAWKIKSLWVRHYRRPLVCAIVNIIIAKASTWDTTKQRGNRKWDLRVGQCGNIWLLPRDLNSRSYIRSVAWVCSTKPKTKQQKTPWNIFSFQLALPGEEWDASHLRSLFSMHYAFFFTSFISKCFIWRCVFFLFF